MIKESKLKENQKLGEYEKAEYNRMLIGIFIRSINWDKVMDSFGGIQVGVYDGPEGSSEGVVLGVKVWALMISMLLAARLLWGCSSDGH